jgi:hypothetical protein
MEKLVTGSTPVAELNLEERNLLSMAHRGASCRRGTRRGASCLRLSKRRGSVFPIGIPKLPLTCTTRPSPTSTGEENPETNVLKERT